MRWIGHDQRRDNDYIGLSKLRLEPPGRRPAGKRFIDVVKEDMIFLGVRVEDAEDRTK